MYPVVLSGLVNDAPAKSFVLKTKGHTGYYSCSRCIQRGKQSDNRVYFPLVNSPLRTHQSFLHQHNKDYHIGTSCLTELPDVDLIISFPMDYMHLVCIGVVKKLIRLWLTGKVPIRLPYHKVSQLSSALVQCKSFITNDFARKPRPVQDVGRWKATEFRQFLLYTGPCCFAVSSRQS